MTITELFQETRDLVDADTKSYPDVKLLRRMNTAYENIAGILINVAGTWDFDDTNYTTLPIGTGTLIEGQSSYSFSTIFLDVKDVKIKDLNGHWHILKPIDQSQRHEALENLVTPAGFPQYYDKDGNTITLYPAPTATAVTLAQGLKIEFKRTAQLFTTADIATGTIQPGFASPFHIILALKAALPYALSYKKDRVAYLNSEITNQTALLIAHYGQREMDKRKVMSNKPISHR